MPENKGYRIGEKVGYVIAGLAVIILILFMFLIIAILARAIFS